MAIATSTAVLAAGALAAGATVASGVMSSKASAAASEAAAKGQGQALSAASSAARRAEGQVIPAFEGARQSAQQGFDQGLGFLQGALPNQIQPFQAGNVAAQQQIARGLPQIQNAILGNPTDLSGFQAQQIPFSIPQIPQIQQQQQAAPVVGGNFNAPGPVFGGNAALHPFNQPLVGGVGIAGGTIPAFNTKIGGGRNRFARDFER